MDSEEYEICGHCNSCQSLSLSASSPSYGRMMQPYSLPFQGIPGPPGPKGQSVVGPRGPAGRVPFQCAAQLSTRQPKPRANSACQLERSESDLLLQIPRLTLPELPQDAPAPAERYAWIESEKDSYVLMATAPQEDGFRADAAAQQICSEFLEQVCRWCLVTRWDGDEEPMLGARKVRAEREAKLTPFWPSAAQSRAISTDRLCKALRFEYSGTYLIMCTASLRAVLPNQGQLQSDSPLSVAEFFLPVDFGIGVSAQEPNENVGAPVQFTETLVPCYVEQGTSAEDAVGNSCGVNTMVRVEAGDYVLAQVRLRLVQVAQQENLFELMRQLSGLELRAVHCSLQAIRLGPNE